MPLRGPDTFVERAPGGNVRDFLGAANQMGSLMERKQRLRMAEENHAIEQAQAAIMLPLDSAKAQSDIAKARTDYQVALGTQEARRSAYQLYDQAATDFNYVNQITDAKVRADASREWLSRYSQLSNVKELEPQVKTMNSLATSNIEGLLKVNMLGTAQERSFAAMTQGMAEDEVAKAKRVRLGLEGRASSAGQKSLAVKLPNGAEAQMTFDPNTGEYSIPQLSGGATSPTDGNTMVGMGVREEAEAKTSGTKDAEYQATLRAAKPKREAALQRAESLTDDLTTDLDSLISKVTVATAGPGGVVLSNFPGTTARDFGADLDSIKSRIMVQTLQAIREASPTGGAFGNMTEKEGERLMSMYGALEVGQSPKQLIERLKTAKQRIARAHALSQTAFESEYVNEQVAPATPIVIKSIKRID